MEQDEERKKLIVALETLLGPSPPPPLAVCVCEVEKSFVCTNFLFSLLLYRDDEKSISSLCLVFALLLKLLPSFVPQS